MRNVRRSETASLGNGVVGPRCDACCGGFGNAADRGAGSTRFDRLAHVALTLACLALPVPAVASNILLAKAGGVSGESRIIERGRYLVMVGGCNDCHTAGFLPSGGRTPEQDRLTGSDLGWRGPWGTTYPVNLRLFFQDITEQQWIALARERQPRPPMPYFALNAMSTSDARALYRYIRYLGPAGAPAPKFVPPDREPRQPYVMFPAR